MLRFTLFPRLVGWMSTDGVRPVVQAALPWAWPCLAAAYLSRCKVTHSSAYNRNKYSGKKYHFYGNAQKKKKGMKDNEF